MRLHFVYRCHNQAMAEVFISWYGQTPLDLCEYIIVLGGDGTMLDSLGQYHAYQKPFYGINYGTMGYLMNAPIKELETLEHHLTTAQHVTIFPLNVQLVDDQGRSTMTYAFNEVALFRQRYQTLFWRLQTEDQCIEGKGDGCIVATPLGSTAYNASAGGIRLPLFSEELVITPLHMCLTWASSMPNSWCVPRQRLILQVLSPHQRPGCVGIDAREYPSIEYVDIFQDIQQNACLLFQKEKDLSSIMTKNSFL